MNPPDQPTQPTEAHFELAKNILFARDVSGRSMTAQMVVQLIADSEARAVEAWKNCAQKVDAKMLAEQADHNKTVDRLIEAKAALTAERERVRVLREALAALLGDEWRMSCDWGPSSEREPITEEARSALAATKEGA
jgi:hypothetical protein